MSAGVLVIDKPQGLTSHDVVAAARRVLGERRIGHCGTLDPMATGVLALAVGQATRLAQFLTGDAKEYDAVVRFGEETATYDATGDVVARSSRRPANDEVEAALGAFRGGFDQVPPAYSAKKVDGVRAYARARQVGPGAMPPLRAVPVVVERLDLLSFDGERARLSMRVSAGFYVRALAHDLGRAVGTGAVLETLRRTRAGAFPVEAALPFEAFVSGGREAALAQLVPIDRLLPDVPAMVLAGPDAGRVGHGLDVAAPAGWQAAPPPLVRLLDDDARLVALAVPGGPGLLHPSVVFG